MAKFSVIIPSYNHASYLPQAVQSVLDQTCRDLELIVVDDGSTDSSGEVLRSFSDPRMRLIFQENQGAHAAINRGLEEASGEYLSILNSDDAYHPQRLEKAHALYKQDPDAGLVSSYIEIIDRDGAVLGVKHAYQDCSPWELASPEKSFRAQDNLRLALLTENYLATTSNYIFPRRLYEQTGDFLPLRYTHDWDFALRAARRSQLRLLPEALVRYRIHSSNTIRENQAAMVYEICWIMAVHLPQAVGEPWFPSADRSVRTSQLLNSIYTYGCEKILAVMLLHRLDQDPALALKLLEPGNPVRGELLQAVQDQLNRFPHPITPARGSLAVVRRVLHRLRRQ
jgi:glycosyltransferase involved in cell wall biosynthesis